MQNKFFLSELKKSRKLLLAIILGAVFVFGFAGLALYYNFFSTTSLSEEEKGKRAALAERNIARGFIEISINEVPLKIPIEYVARWLTFLDGEKKLFSFGLYEELTPNQHILGSIRVIIQPKNLNYIGDQESLTKALKVEVKGEPGPYGLFFHPLRKEFKQTFDYIKVYSFPVEGGFDLIFNCIHETCISTYRNMDDLSIYYTFSLNQLENWKIIHDHVTGLVFSFIDGAKNE